MVRGYYLHLDFYLRIWVYGHMQKKYGVSSKRASKMQLRDVVLRSIGHRTLQSKVMAKNFFFRKKIPCILLITLKNIRYTISRLVRDLVQKAKWSKIFRRKRIQALPTISNNLWESDWV